MGTIRRDATKRRAMVCPDCGIEMIHHADKLVDPRTAEEARLVDPDLGGMIEETHSCPGCGQAASRRAG